MRCLSRCAPHDAEARCAGQAARVVYDLEAEGKRAKVKRSLEDKAML